MIDDIDPYRWTSPPNSDDHESEPYEHDYHTGRHASRGQMVLAKNQVDPLTAASGNCLLIVTA